VPSQLQEIIDAIRRRPFVEPWIELERFAKEETFHGQGGQERRRFRRYSLITNVIVLPLDDGLRPVGEPFVALSSGMSVDGMRLIHTDPSPTDHLFIEIDGQPVRFVLSVLRSCPIGPCFEIAGRLLNADVVNQEMESPVLSAGSSSAISGDEFGTPPAEFLPTFDEFAHWAGVSAAVQLLGADLSAKSHRA
jgi:hypothetical protein